jgi:hypothetical protein
VGRDSCRNAANKEWEHAGDSLHDVSEGTSLQNGVHKEWVETGVEMLQIKSGNTLETIYVNYRKAHLSKWCA